MLTALIPTIAKVVVSTSAGVAINSAVQMITPTTINALPGFGVKVGVAVGAAVVTSKLGKYIETSVAGIMAQIQSAGQQEEPQTEEN